MRSQPAPLRPGCSSITSQDPAVGASAHVTFGVLQSELSAIFTGAVAVGLLTVLGLHIIASRKEIETDREHKILSDDGFIDVCAVADIPENRARIVFCPANAWRFSNTTEKFPPSQMFASTRTARSAKAKLFPAASPVRGMATNIYRKQARRRRRLWKKSRRSTCA